VAPVRLGYTDKLTDLNQADPLVFSRLPVGFSCATFSPLHMPRCRSLVSIRYEVFGPLLPLYAAVVCVL